MRVNPVLELMLEKMLLKGACISIVANQSKPARGRVHEGNKVCKKVSFRLIPINSALDILFTLIPHSREKKAETSQNKTKEDRKEATTN